MPSKSIWITNISNKDIHISDLGLVIKSYSSIKLLNNSRLPLAEEQILKSINSGVISKKKELIIGNNTPNQIVVQKKEISTNTIPDRSRSLKEIKEEKYEELNLSDEEYINQISEIIEDK